jgi:[ribosomal protein S5]-alanine N-acetyltransferase
MKKENISIRKYRISDLDKLCDLFIDNYIIKDLGSLDFKKINKKSEEKWLKDTLKKYKTKNPGSLSWAIEYNGEYVGGIGMHGADYENEKTEIGYWIGKPYWGQGIATDALCEFLNILDKKYNFKRITALAFSYNVASQRVLEKAGFKFEGLLKKNAKKDGKFYDDKLYARVR